MDNTFAHQLQYEAFREKLGKAICIADLSNPDIFRSRELRSLTDHSVRAALSRAWSQFTAMLYTAADVAWLAEGISLKRQDNVFPRLYKKQTGKLKGKITAYGKVVISNALGGKELTFDAPWLLAYQPQDDLQNFTYGVMAATKVIEKTKRSGDQWILQDIVDEDWLVIHKLGRFEIIENLDEFKSQQSAEWLDMTDKFYQKSYDSLENKVRFTSLLDAQTNELLDGNHPGLPQMAAQHLDSSQSILDNMGTLPSCA